MYSSPASPSPASQSSPQLSPQPQPQPQPASPVLPPSPSPSPSPPPQKKSLTHRLKYFLLRQNRPFNIDEISAFFSWILMGNVLWILIGTTTFFGFLIYIVNWIGDGEIERMVLKKLLTFDNKLNMDLTSKNFKATWVDGKIKIRNLRVLSPPGQTRSNYQFEINEINLTFSFNKWLDGMGLIDGIEIDGLNGDVNIVDNDELRLDESFNDRYILNHLKVKHSHIKFHNDKYFKRPLELVIFNCELDKLRRKWMVYDFLNANSMFGSLGGSLFTLHKRQHRFAQFGENNDSNNVSYEDEELRKRITRLRIDMLDLSFLNNENSKLNWIKSGKAEVIFDILMPEDDLCTHHEKKIDKFSLDLLKEKAITVYKKIIDQYEEPQLNLEMNKYVVIDMKINYYNLKAKMPSDIPCSSLTGKPYISAPELQSLITFINDEKFGLSSANFQQISNGIDADDDTYTEYTQDDSIEDNDYNEITINDDDDESSVIDKNKMLPPIKFRIIQNLNDFEYLDLPSLISFTSLPKPEDCADEKIIKSFVNTNKFIDASITEVLSLLLVYKEEIQTNLIGLYSRRSGFEILFNNFILGNLILVGLGSFVI
ncbi:hypothetical protein CANINC_001232 [Pichia inconspicua]|uniref:Mitochondrial distribution and morphology protein 31 n=1 Tax=Pichia inconspicua TaxID=52247 RepID=A0A4T0X4L7_9ASCO|nr:hypothetical protein CANINC_001232 [[Candida] inconspicua]